MTVKHSAIIAALLLLCAVLGASLSLYGARQSEMTREGNNLYSGDAARVEASFAEISDRRESFGPDLAVWLSLGPGSPIRALWTKDYRGVVLPLHQGRSFTAEDTRAALVGSAVPIAEVSGGGAVYEWEGELYPVVGYLGVEEQGLLADQVVLRGDALFSTADAGSFVLDGTHAYRDAAEVFGTEAVSPVNSGTHRRTNIDFVSVTLLGLGVTVVLVGSAFIGALAGELGRRRNRVRLILGASPRRIFSTDLGILAGLSLVIAVACVLVLLASGGGVVRVSAIAGLTALQIVLTLGTFSVLALIRWRRDARGTAS